MKKEIASFLAATMIVSTTSGFAFASNFDDMPTDWSTAALEATVSNGLLKGDNGKIMPKAFLTRAQMATIINRAFGTTEKASLSKFKDVAKSAWYYEEMAKTVQMEAFKGSGDQLNPDNNITRQEAFVVLARAFKMSTTDDKALNQFSDKGLVSSWAKDGISALVSNGYVNGADGKLNPTQNITRAEFAQIMDNLVKTYMNKADTYTQDIDGNVMVNVADVTLKDMTIKGDLIIGDGVGSGDVTLNNVVVEGTTIVRGGGVNSIHIIGKSNVKDIVIARVNGEVRVFAKDGTEVGNVIVDGKDDVVLEGNIGKVAVEAAGITVTAKNADIEDVTVDGVKSKIVADKKTTIKKLTVNAENAEVVAEKGAKIKKVIANKKGVEISGSGTVTAVDANANDIIVKTKGTSVSAAKGTTGVKNDGESVKAGQTDKSSGGSTGGGSGSSSHGTSAKEVKILGKESIGLPTSKVGVKMGTVTIKDFELYFDGTLVTSTKDGEAEVANAILEQLSRVEVKIDGGMYEDADGKLGTLEAK